MGCKRAVTKQQATLSKVQLLTHRPACCRAADVALLAGCLQLRLGWRGAGRGVKHTVLAQPVGSACKDTCTVRCWGTTA
jgi:hypothetical protein